MKPLRSNSLNLYKPPESQPPLRLSLSPKRTETIKSLPASIYIVKKCQQFLTSSNDTLVISFMKKTCEQIKVQFDDIKDPNTKDISTDSDMIRIFYSLFNLTYSLLQRVNNKRLILVLNELIGLYISFSRKSRGNHNLFLLLRMMRY